MPNVSIIVGNVNCTLTISASDLSTRLLPALHYFYPGDSKTDQRVTQEWINSVLRDLNTKVADYENSKIVVPPPFVPLITT